MPRIIFLDQNKWIDLLRAEHSPGLYSQQFTVLQNLEGELAAGKVVIPLTSTNIYETYKIAAPERRTNLARLQARLSGGLVFRGRHARIKAELSDFLSNVYELALPPRPAWWFLSDVFFEAFADNDDERTNLLASPPLMEAIQQQPAEALFHYLTTAREEERANAVKNWSDGSEALRTRVEARGEQSRNETLPMRRRIYNALIFDSEVKRLAEFAIKYGVEWNSTSDIGAPVARRLVNEMPIFMTERELVLRLEAQDRPIVENDFRDVDAYCAAIPYADDVIGENLLVNVARQARLGEKYVTRLETDILSLAE